MKSFCHTKARAKAKAHPKSNRIQLQPYSALEFATPTGKSRQTRTKILHFSRKPVQPTSTSKQPEQFTDAKTEPSALSLGRCCSRQQPSSSTTRKQKLCRQDLRVIYGCPKWRLTPNRWFQPPCGRKTPLPHLARRQNTKTVKTRENATRPQNNTRFRPDGS